VEPKQPINRRFVVCAQFLARRVNAMGKDRHQKNRQNRLAPFVPMLVGTLDSEAWRAMSHGARSLYVALKRRYNQTTHNNGRIFLSQRNAAEELNSHHGEIARWFRELQHYGFIVRTAVGSLGVYGRGKAPHWRLTEVGYMGEGPTREFDRWDKTKFRDKKTGSRAGNGAGSVPKKEHTGVQEMAHIKTQKRAGNGAHTAAPGVPEMAHISRLPSASLPAPAPPASHDDEGSAVASVTALHRFEHLTIWCALSASAVGRLREQRFLLRAQLLLTRPALTAA
jgi:hypothetical protein